jgi:urease accessory protein
MKALVAAGLGAGSVLAAAPAAAHGLADAATFMSGLAHPPSGADHVLAMVAVGLWSVLAGGRALWLWPAAFVACMLGGFGLGLSGASLPYVEAGILASVVVLSLLVAFTVRAKLPVGAAVVGLFALFHGHAHGVEAPVAGHLLYALGFVAATAALHLAGIALGTALIGRMGRWALRASGVAAAAGVGLIAS